ncbi:GGDEF domain-containing protein [Noviherbaspirillum sp. Root189]|uniref:GGDEF domain-containing protein n=1 Tax=Noviherbaspirillum sp. Root189 TaxID=1736487 RepID=UPI000709E83B|nr:GGDEF domain-containing protein [Noviherbaspirillum sp. Root189]KRB93309.1 diguanylate cyclase [Noviherbaspirillum sp. Root189]
MQDKEKKPEPQSPADIAREAFRRLAMRRVAPTPDAYREIYEEIAGTQTTAGPEKILADFAAHLAGTSADIARHAAKLSLALEKRDWPEYGKSLSQLVEQHLASQSSKDAAQPAKVEAVAQPIATPPALKSAGIPLVDTPAPVALKSAGLALVDPPATAVRPSVESLATANVAVAPESRQLRLLRELLVRTLTLALGSLLRKAPELLEESEMLASSARNATTEPALNDISARLKQLCFRIELKADDLAEEHELLLRLFQLLLENVGELLEDDSWLSGQIANVQDLLSGPLSRSALLDATRSLKEVIYKQGALKHSLKEAKVTVKNMMITFIDRLGAVATSTGDFHQKMGNYSQKISQARDITELNHILEDVMRDTRHAQTEILRSQDDIIAAKQEVQEAEARIQQLESKLEHMSELVREDQLTGSLNRRGLDDAYEREIARAQRRKTSLCIALLDLDDFKRLNDTYGHSAGDDALIHLVRVIKETLRTMDVVARFGGEEFLIMLPDTPLDEAVQTVTRIQRELTKRIFMYDNQKLLMTFSAGVALRRDDEDQGDLIKRADEALYKAKRAGKNRVVAAD